jgi:hypothetical protein
MDEYAILEMDVGIKSRTGIIGKLFETSSDEFSNRTAHIL